jgi:hypothetical protein
MYSSELLRVEAAECRRGAIGKSARVERTLLALAQRLESQATVLEARESADLPRLREIMRNLSKSSPDQ